MKSRTIQIYTDDTKCHRWRMVSPNGRILSDGNQPFNRRSICLRNILLVTGLRVKPWDSRVTRGDGEWFKVEWEGVR